MTLDIRFCTSETSFYVAVDILLNLPVFVDLFTHKCTFSWSPRGTFTVEQALYCSIIQCLCDKTHLLLSVSWAQPFIRASALYINRSWALSMHCPIIKGFCFREITSLQHRNQFTCLMSFFTSSFFLLVTPYYLFFFLLLGVRTI